MMLRNVRKRTNEITLSKHEPARSHTPYQTPFTADAEDEETQTFVADFEEAFGDTPNQFAADAYDCIYVIKEAAEKADLTPDMSISDMCDAMKTAMTEITIDGLTGKQITWGSPSSPHEIGRASCRERVSNPV